MCRAAQRAALWGGFLPSTSPRGHGLPCPQLAPFPGRAVPGAWGLHLLLLPLKDVWTSPAWGPQGEAAKTFTYRFRVSAS